MGLGERHAEAGEKFVEEGYDGLLGKVVRRQEQKGLPGLARAVELEEQAEVEGMLI